MADQVPISISDVIDFERTFKEVPDSVVQWTTTQNHGVIKARELIDKLGKGLLRRLHVAATTATAREVERLQVELHEARGVAKEAKAQAGERMLYLATWAAAFAKASGLVGVDDQAAGAQAEKVARAAVAEAKRRGVIK